MTTAKKVLTYTAGTAAGTVCIAAITYLSFKFYDGGDFGQVIKAYQSSPLLDRTLGAANCLAYAFMGAHAGIKQWESWRKR